MPHDVFISFSSEDQPHADLAFQVFSQAGLTCWYSPRQMQSKVGAAWDEEILRGIDEARFFFVVLSSSAQASPEVHKEVVRAARKGGPPRLVFVLPGTRIDQRSWVSYHTGPFQRDESLDDMSVRLQRIAQQIKLAGAPGTTAPGVLADDLAVLQGYCRSMTALHSRLRGWSVNGRRAPEVELDKAYVALRAVEASLYEQKKNREWIERNRVSHRVGLQGHGSGAQSYEPPLQGEFMRERDRPKSFASQELGAITLTQAVKHHRALVILGDPGSGKTTLGRWVTLKFASQIGQGRVLVPAMQVDPTADPDASDIDLGPTRLPVFVRVGDFAEALKKDRSTSLVSFVGSGNHHLTPVYPPGHGQHGQRIPPPLVADLILRHLSNNSALIVLDGLDEVPSGDIRALVLREIQGFIGSFVTERQIADEPCFAGGNQVIVTSRIVGYASMPLECDIAQYTIEPLAPAAVRHFCDVWVQAYGASSGQMASLYEDLSKPQTRTFLELARTPLLIGILASVYMIQNGALPNQRADLYRIAFEDNLREQWAQRQGGRQLVDIHPFLEELAWHMHRESSMGIIDRQALRIFGEAYIRKRMPDCAPAFLEEFKSSIENDCGLLVEKGHGKYAFMHLSFQEYFCGLYIVNHAATAAAHYAQLMSDPRWREPLLLGLGHASCSWPREELDRLVHSMLTSGGTRTFGALPALLLCTAAIQDGVRLTPTSTQLLCECLVDLVADIREASSSTASQDTYSLLIGITSQLEQTASVGGYVHDTLLRSLASGTRRRKLAAAQLLLACGIFSGPIANALAASMEVDSERDGWVIEAAFRTAISLAEAQDRLTLQDATSQRQATALSMSEAEVTALRKIKLQVPAALEKKRRGQRINLAQQPSIRRFLARDTQALAHLRADAEMSRIVLALHGGLSDFGLPQLFEEHAILDRALQDPSTAGRGLRPYAEELDVRIAPRLAVFRKCAPELNTDYLYLDSGLTDLVIGRLMGDTTRDEALRLWWQLVEHLPGNVGAGEPPGNNPASPDSLPPVHPDQVDACIALLASGEHADMVLARVAGAKCGIALLSAVSERLGRIRFRLSDPLLRCKLAIEGMDLAGVGAQEAMDIARSAIGVLICHGSQPVQVAHLLSHPGLAQDPRIIAEVLSYMVSGVGDDPVYNAMVTIDTVGGLLTRDRQLFLDALADMHTAQNNGWSAHRFRSASVTRLGQGSARTCWPAALAAIESFPKDFDLVASWAYCALGPLLDGEPGLRELVQASVVQSLGSSPELDETLRVLGCTDATLETRSLAVTGTAYATAVHPFYGLCLELKLALQAARTAGPPIPAADLTASAAQAGLLRQRLNRICAIADNSERWTLLHLYLSLGLPDALRVETMDELIQCCRAMDSAADRIEAFTASLDVLDAQGIAKTAELIVADVQLAGRLLPTQYGRPHDPVRPWPALVPSGDLRGGRNELRSVRLLQAGCPFASVTTWAVLVLAAIVDDARAICDEQLRFRASTIAGSASSRGGPSEGGQAAGTRLNVTMAKELQDMGDAQLTSSEQLIHRITSCETGAVSYLMDWSRRRVDSLGDLAAVLLAERRQYGVRGVTRLVDLLSSPSDSMRVRAALALYGSSSPRDQLPASALGTEVLLALAGIAVEQRPREPARSLAIRWTFERIRFDDVQILRDLIAHASVNGRDRAPGAIEALSSLHHASGAVWRELAAHLDRHDTWDLPADVMAALLDGLYGLVNALGTAARQGSQVASIRRCVVRLGLSDQRAPVRAAAAAVVGLCGDGAEDFLATLAVCRSGAEPCLASFIAAGRMAHRVMSMKDTALDPAWHVLVGTSSQMSGAGQPTGASNAPLVRDWVRQALIDTAVRFNPGDTALSQPDLRAACSLAMLLKAGFTARECAEIHGDPSTVLSGLILAAIDRFYSLEYRECIDAAARFVCAEAGTPVFMGSVPMTLFESVFWRLHRALSGTAPEDDLHTKDMLLAVAAGVVELNPAGFKLLVESTLGESFVADVEDAVVGERTFTGRMAAAVLLSHIGRLSSRGMQVLGDALQDVPYVRDAVLASAVRYRAVSDSVLADFRAQRPSDGRLRYVFMAQMLAAIANSEDIQMESRERLRSELIPALSAALTDTQCQQEIEVLTRSTSGDYFRLRSLGRMDSILRGLLLSLTSVPAGDLALRKPWIAECPRVLVPTDRPASGSQPGTCSLVLPALPFTKSLAAAQVALLASDTGNLDADVRQVLEKVIGHAEQHLINFGALVTELINAPITAA